MSELRRALYRNDGAAMLAAVSGAGFDRCLQLVGDVVIAALDREAGADDLARRCVEAVRTRAWDGDEQLADTIEQARAAVQSGELVELEVDLEQLADLLEAGQDSAGGRIDLAAGEVWPEAAFEEDWTDELDDRDAADDEGERWLAVWPLGSRAAYRDMADFAATRTDAGLVARLQVALDGRGAFGRFKNVLVDWPDDRQDWFEFSDDLRLSSWTLPAAKVATHAGRWAGCRR
jgi:hypothetical protein